MNFDVGEFDFELDTVHRSRQARRPAPRVAQRPAPKPAPKPAPPPLTAADVQVAMIDKPAQQSLLRISADLKTRAAAAQLLEHVKQRRLAGICCLRSKLADARVRRLGSRSSSALLAGEDAVVLLDPNDLHAGAPMIAFRHELDPGCGLSPGQKPSPAQPAKLDAALLKALTSFTVWREGISLGRLGKCALAPLDDPRKTVSAARIRSMKVLGNVLPRLLCQASAVPTTPGTPKLVRHRHVSFNCDDAFAFKADGPAIDMTPANMNPRFIMPDDSISYHKPLNDKLRDLVTNKFKDLINPTSASSKNPQATDKLHIALVDLSGARKLCQPEFAGFGESFNEPGASTSKILLFYAAHQLQFDLEQLVAANSIRTLAELQKKLNEVWAVFTCRPQIGWLFNITESRVAGVLLKVEMHNNLKTIMNDIVTENDSTPNAARLIIRLGFEYIASVAWQSGLRHPTRGGIWYGSTYCIGLNPEGQDASCHRQLKDGEQECPGGSRRVLWTADPLGIQAIKGSALSFATYMTLLAQGRLVDNANSAKIEAILKKACGVVKHRITGMRANKCGDTSNSLHDAVIIERGKIRYVIAFTLRSSSKGDPVRNRLRDMLADIDALIVAANP